METAASVGSSTPLSSSHSEQDHDGDDFPENHDDSVDYDDTSDSEDSANYDKKQHRVCFRYSIDVLSNGTEYTSCCVNNNDATIPALFLSIWKITTVTLKNNEVDMDDVDVDDYEGRGLLLARYGLSGVGSCDGLGRIAADQQYKVGPIRAVFFMMMNHPYRDDDHDCSRSSSGGDSHSTNASSSSSSSSSILSDFASLPSALYACQQESLSLILPNPNILDRVEQLVQLLHGNHSYPKVLLCSVPETTRKDTSQQISMHPLQWWKVFEDDHIVVHAARCALLPNGTCHFNRHDEIIYLLTFLRLVHQQFSLR